LEGPVGGEPGLNQFFLEGIEISGGMVALPVFVYVQHMEGGSHLRC
jgi:hypothetical protein